MVLQSLLTDIEKLVTTSVVKFEQRAKLYETTVSARFADSYSEIKSGTDKFESYSVFEVNAIRLATGILWSMDSRRPDSIFNVFDPESLPHSSGINDTEAMDTTSDSRRYSIGEFATNPSLIPESYRGIRDCRGIVLAAQRSAIIHQYDSSGDLNDYYREISGYPSLTSESIYLTDDEYASIGITESADKAAIHKLSNSNINKLKGMGILDKYISMYPNEKYLLHMGVDAIDAYTARKAKNFALLKTTSDVPSSVYDTFHTIYDQNRDYVMYVIYNKDMYNSYPMYDNFIGFIIMIMTIQRVISSSFKKAIQRDLYDWTFIHNLYKSYNIPFIEDLSLDQHVILTKNFNKLLQYKGTDKVLFDICSLFGTDEITISKYYLVKDQKFDQVGNPIISDDPEDQYNLEFRAVDLDEDNVHLALQNSTNILSYSDVVDDDPYWWDSGDLKNTILESEFNYIESKYISLSVMYKATELMLDAAYAFRLIFDKKDAIDNISSLTIKLPKISSDKRFKLFDIMAFLIAITCRNNGMIGQVLDENDTYDFYIGGVPTAIEISHMYGFNFNEESLTSIRNLVNTYENILDMSVVNYFNSIDTTHSGILTNVDVSNLYSNIRGLREALIIAMRNTNKTEDYYIYKNIYNVLLSEQSVSDMFTVNGVQYTTYSSYIEAVEPMLYAYVDPLAEHSISDRNEILEHTLVQLENAIESFDILDTIVGDSTSVYNAIMALIRFFKSYTVDIHTFNVIYLLDDKYFNAIKTIDKIGHFDSHIYPKTHLNMSYADNMITNTSIKHNDHNILRDSLSIYDNDENTLIYPNQLI